MSDGEALSIAEALRRVSAGETLSRRDMRGVIVAIMHREAEPVVVSALLAALRTRGETIDELAGAAEAMRSLALELPESPAGAIDTCGTGGDGAGTFNISTVAALVVAGAGVPVAKHGNRAATSRCGSAELIEALGVPIDGRPSRMAEAVKQIGIGFLYARACHPAMAAVGPIRAALPIPTLFNRLGPLTNPMRVRRQLLGVGHPEMMSGALDTLERLGSERVWVVHAEDGLDEISTCQPTQVYALEDGRTRRFAIEPERYVPRAGPEDLAGGDPEHNAAIARSVLAGEPGPRRDVVVLNAAAALCVAGLASELEEGVKRAGEAIDSGSARDLLERWVRFMREEEGS